MVTHYTYGSSVRSMMTFLVVRSRSSISVMTVRFFSLWTVFLWAFSSDLLSNDWLQSLHCLCFRLTGGLIGGVTRIGCGTAKPDEADGSMTDCGFAQERAPPLASSPGGGRSLYRGSSWGGSGWNDQSQAIKMTNRWQGINTTSPLTGQSATVFCWTEALRW